MKIPCLHASLAVITVILTVTVANARPYGVSSTSVGRGTAYTTSRGRSAYVGPRGGAVHGVNDRTAVNAPRGAAYAGPNAAAVTTRHGAAAVGPNGAAYATRSTVGYATTRTVAAAPLPHTYIRTVPAGSRTVVYQGATCYYSGGVYYRPVFYGGTTVYVVVP